jgi:hypothetical protein
VPQPGALWLSGYTRRLTGNDCPAGIERTPEPLYPNARGNFEFGESQMIKVLKLSTSAAALMLLVGGAMSSAQAADYVEPGCTLSGTVAAGFLYDWHSADPDFSSEDFDVDWSTPFGEGAGLVTCGGFNIQADVAYYAHSGDISDFSSTDVDIDQTKTHIGGVLFYRDPASWAGGLQASWISQDFDGADIDTFRVGLFGEFYLDDVFTLGASAHYYSTDWPSFVDGKDEDGFQLAAWGRFYATPDFSLMLRGDVLLADIDFNNRGNADWDGFAITGEGEYLVWDQGLSLFAGARYAEREFDIDDSGAFDLNDFQVYGGVKFYFGQGGTLLERQRTGPVDNTSTFDEKLPRFFGGPS